MSAYARPRRGLCLWRNSQLGSRSAYLRRTTYAPTLAAGRIELAAAYAPTSCAATTRCAWMAWRSTRGDTGL
jgi:hypothetical protein